MVEMDNRNGVFVRFTRIYLIFCTFVYEIDLNLVGHSLGHLNPVFPGLLRPGLHLTPVKLRSVTCTAGIRNWNSFFPVFTSIRSRSSSSCRTISGPREASLRLGDPTASSDKTRMEKVVPGGGSVREPGSSSQTWSQQPKASRRRRGRDTENRTEGDT